METGIPKSVDTNVVVSVIIPVYNGEEYLAGCLDTIVAQTMQNIEIVIVDDGSTDSSGEIADQYRETHKENIQVLHQENSGVSRARVNGILVARGEWIGFVDADDEIEPDMYERLLKNAVEHGAQISHCGYQTIVNKGERIHYFYNTGQIKVQNNEEGVRDLLQGEFVEPGVWNKLFKRSLFDDIIRDCEPELLLRYNEDLFLNYLLFKGADCSIYEDFCPYHYMARPQSATRRAFDAAKYTDPVMVWKRILQEVPQEMRTTALHKYLLACFTAYAELLHEGDEPQVCNEYRNELIKYKSEWHNLRRPDRLRIHLIMKSPALYQIINNLYIKAVQKKRYE